MWATPDLSDITLILTGLITQAVTTSPLPLSNKISVSACSPETMRNNGDQCYLNLYLLHIGRDPYWRNTPLSGPRPQLNSVQPLSLNLSYLLTAYCDQDTVLEQRALSIALAAIQSNPIMNANTTAGIPEWTAVPNGEFVVSIEADTIEEMSRLWQAFTVPIRLSALIRASVIFIEAPDVIEPPALPPSTVNLSVIQAASLPAPLISPPNTPAVLGDGFSQFTPPLLDGTLPASLAPGIGPLVMVGGVPAPVPPTTSPLFGAYLVIAGSGLDLADAAEIYLSSPGSSTLWDITAWRQGFAPSQLTISPPDSYAAPAGSKLTATPLPGLYSLAVGSGGTVNSNSVTVAIAPRIDGVVNPPTLDPGIFGEFTVTGAGFLPAAKVTLALGSNPLTFSGGAAPPAGGFIVNPAGTAITFLPGALAAGSYPLLLAVNGVPAPIGWLAVVS
jgi:hypothetical protein